jgi:hypothetical protein
MLKIIAAAVAVAVAAIPAAGALRMVAAGARLTWVVRLTRVARRTAVEGLRMAARAT